MYYKRGNTAGITKIEHKMWQKPTMRNLKSEFHYTIQTDKIIAHFSILSVDVCQ